MIPTTVLCDCNYPHTLYQKLATFNLGSPAVVPKSHKTHCEPITLSVTKVPAMPRSSRAMPLLGRVGFSKTPRCITAGGVTETARLSTESVAFDHRETTTDCRSLQEAHSLKANSSLFPIGRFHPNEGNKRLETIISNKLADESQLEAHVFGRRRVRAGTV